MGGLLNFFGETEPKVTVAMCSERGVCFGEKVSTATALTTPKYSRCLCRFSASIPTRRDNDRARGAKELPGAGTARADLKTPPGIEVIVNSSYVAHLAALTLLVSKCRSLNIVPNYKNEE